MRPAPVQPVVDPAARSPYVAADGSGDYPTIEDAVANIDTGQTIYLGPGTFHLSDTLLVNFSFNLVGSGIDKTTVTCNGTVVDVESASFGHRTSLSNQPRPPWQPMSWTRMTRP